MQFHPEVVHTDRGAEMLSAFLFKVAGCEPTWTPGSFADEAVAEDPRRRSARASARLRALRRRRLVGRGGARVQGHRRPPHLHLRGQRPLAAGRGGAGRAHVPRPLPPASSIHVDAGEQFLTALEGVTDPEQKRKIIGRIFIDVFDAEAAKLGDVDFLVQGTLYPDVIESVSFKGGRAR